jgi:TonB family protein
MKNIKISLFLGILFCLFSFATFAQEKKPKVLKYEAPKYPPAAKATRADGTVVVKIEIDKDGKVISSVAESGHILLKKTCEAVSKNWIFSKDKVIEKREVKINYIFRVDDKAETEKTRFKKPYTIEIIGFNNILY